MEQQFESWLRGLLWSSLVGIYGITLVVCGIVTPLSDFLSGADPRDGLSTPFHIYLTLVSIIFMIYVEIYVFMYVRQKKRTHGAQSHRQSGFTSGNKLEVEEIDGKEVFIPKLAYVSEGVNNYTRMGAFVFGSGALLLDIFILYQYKEDNDRMMHCYGHKFIVMIASRILFYICQLFFIFRHHRLVMNFHKEVVKLGVVHLLATNISIWAFAVIFEAAHSLEHGAGHGDHSSGHDHHSNNTLDHAQTHNNYTVTTEDPHHGRMVSTDSHDTGGDSEGNLAVECRSGETLFAKSSPYLFPLTIEFVLIGVTVAYKTYSNIGATINPDFIRIMFDTRKEAKEDSARCRRWNYGIIIGHILLVGAIVSTVYFIVLEQANESSLVEMNTIYIYYLSDNVIQFLGAGLVLLCFWKTSRLHFHGHAESQLDQTLLLVTLFGLLLLDTLMIISSAHIFPQDHDNMATDTFTRMQITLGVLTMVQSCAQVAFIFDAMRRCSSTDKDVNAKPGRILITILLILNVAMWVINTFQFKEVQNANLFTEYFGSMAWSIIFNLALPLAIFYRFHSSVCLSDVVLTLYHKIENETLKGCDKIGRDDEIF